MGAIGVSCSSYPFRVRSIAPFWGRTFEDALTGRGTPTPLGNGAAGQIITAQFEIEQAGGDWPGLIRQIEERALATGRRNLSGKAISPVEEDFRTWKGRLPEVGRYEAALWSLAGDPIPSGIAGRIADGRSFRPADAARELRAAGYRGSFGCLLALLALPQSELFIHPITVATFGEEEDVLHDGGKDYLPTHTYALQGDGDSIAKWALEFFLVEQGYYNSSLSLVGFKPLA